MVLWISNNWVFELKSRWKNGVLKHKKAGCKSYTRPNNQSKQNIMQKRLKNYRQLSRYIFVKAMMRALKPPPRFYWIRCRAKGK